MSQCSSMTSAVGHNFGIFCTMCLRLDIGQLAACLCARAYNCGSLSDSSWLRTRRYSPRLPQLRGGDQAYFEHISGEFRVLRRRSKAQL